MASFGGDSDPAELAEPSGPPRAPASSRSRSQRRHPRSPHCAPRLAPTLQPVSGGEPLTPYAPASARRQPPSPPIAENKPADVSSPRAAPPSRVAATVQPVTPAARRRVDAPFPLQQPDASSSAAALQGHADNVRALQHTAEGAQDPSGRKRRGEDLSCDSNTRPFRFGDLYVPTSRQTHASDPLIQMSIAAFDTNNPKDLDIIRTALLALPKGPASILHGDQNPVGDGGAANFGWWAEGEIRDGDGASRIIVEVDAYDVVGPDLLRYGVILSKPWRLFWEKNPLVLHDTDILHAAKGFRGQVNLPKRMTTILQDHPGPVRCFRIDSSRLENDTEQLEEWFNLLKVKKVREVVFVNCKWPKTVTDFPINTLDCESLQRLSLCFIKMAEICLNYVDNLTKIELVCCSISSQELYALVYQCESLKDLSIGIYEGQVIRINSASLEILHIWQSTIKALIVENAVKLQRVVVEAQPWKSARVSVGLQIPPPTVGISITKALVLAEACFNISTQSITINHISTIQDNVPLPTLKRLTLHICLRAKKEKTVFLNLMKSCVELRELTLWRDDEVYVDERLDTIMYDWTATLRNLSCLLHLQSFTIKDYKGGYAELDIASSVLGHAPSLDKLILETNVSTDLIFSGAKAKLAAVVPASVNVSVRCMIGLRESSRFFSDGG